MAIGPIEIQGSITRLQDFAIQRQNEDAKVVSDQTQVAADVKKETENRSSSVSRSDETENNQNKFDAREKGSNEYTRNDNKKKKDEKEKEGKVLIKNQTASFDIRI
ncbi:MAG: hypothetical protein MJ107_02225 [Lachnospiraceae bacterium]|nr:hypothetical protein [Lachnospiraceae bacterium]